ncbi:MAG TPA: hypothetical protein VFR63_15180 [Gaiellaceae bacterium]|nr:hypothetical protein [Gaiellaceae bacterium]
MARIEGEIVIERPPAEVFDVVADERNEPRYDPRLPPPAGAGSGRSGPASNASSRRERPRLPTCDSPWSRLVPA